MHFPFGKSCNKLFGIKCIIFNSSIISRMSSTQQINTYLIIIQNYNIDNQN